MESQGGAGNLRFAALAPSLSQKREISKASLDLRYDRSMAENLFF